MPEENTQTDPPKPDGEKTFTQADVNRIVDDRLKRERAKYADYDDLKVKASEADKSKSDVQKLTEAVTKLQTNLGEERQQSKRSEVARRTGLSLAKVERLKGDTVDELLADAKDVFDVEPDKNDTAGGGKNDDSKGKAGEAGAEEDEDTGFEPKKQPKDEDLTEGTVGSRSEEKSPEQLADEVWKRVHGGL